MRRTVMLAASLPAPPERLCAMYLDAEIHAAFTGAAVTLDARPGGAFSAFGGMLSGKILAIDAPRQIVQAWRSANWPAESIDSTLILTFVPEPAGGRVELVHVNVPDEDYAGVSHGWEKYYWTPWRRYLEQNG